MSDNELIIIVGRTASGKDTLARHLANNGRTILITYTTRPRRPGEGDTHHFIDNADDYPNKWVDTCINGNTYFFLEEDIYKHDILIIDPIGIYKLLSYKSFTRNYRVVYLRIDDDTRKARYIARANASEADYTARNNAESEQFDEFERRIQDDDYRNKHNITVIHNNDELTDLLEELDGTPLGL